MPGKIFDNPLHRKYRIQIRNACSDTISAEVTWVPDNVNYITSDESTSHEGQWFTKTLSIPSGSIRECRAEQ
ncbi:MAG: hypothetical protein V7K64_01925 [Nostoc sp.]|uniref:hypothetical protein n=1 Tax=Nostoc sp. TaxID=1180 RepID=UPI002FF579A4